MKPWRDGTVVFGAGILIVLWILILGFGNEATNDPFSMKLYLSVSAIILFGIAMSWRKFVTSRGRTIDYSKWKPTKFYLAAGYFIFATAILTFLHLNQIGSVLRGEETDYSLFLIPLRRTPYLIGLIFAYVILVVAILYFLNRHQELLLQEIGIPMEQSNRSSEGKNQKLKDENL